MAMTKHAVALSVNGESFEVLVEARRTLADTLRDDLGLTGTKLGCEHGVCGACTVLVDGRAVRSCLMFAVQAKGCEIITVEGTRHRRATRLRPAGVYQEPRASVRLLHGWRANVSAFVPQKQPEPVGRRDPDGVGRQHLPLHRVPKHRQVHRGCRRSQPIAAHREL